MKDIAIYGAGGFGREIACLLKIINEKEPMWNFIGYFDDNKEKGADCQFGKILGGMNELNSWDKSLCLAIAIGSPHTIKKIVENITNSSIEFPNVISPDVVYLDKESCAMGRGNLVCTGCLFSCSTKIGDFNQFNGYITVGHDVKIGNYNSMMPGVRISGEVTIGDENFWGFNSGIIQQKSVGNGVTVGAGAILLRKPKDGCTYVGVPAYIVKY